MDKTNQIEILKKDFKNALLTMRAEFLKIKENIKLIHDNYYSLSELDQFDSFDISTITLQNLKYSWQDIYDYLNIETMHNHPNLLTTQIDITIKKLDAIKTMD